MAPWRLGREAALPTALDPPYCRHYYDLSNFPKNDTRVALERLYLRRAEQERKERAGGGGGAGGAGASSAAVVRR